MLKILLLILTAAAPLRAEILTMTDLDAALAKGAAEKKMVLLKYSAVWCPPCQTLELEVFRVNALDRFEDSLIVVKLDADHLPEKGSHTRFPFRGLPTYYVIGTDGKAVDKGSGYPGKEDFVASVERALAKGKPGTPAAPDAIAGLTALGFKVEPGAGDFLLVSDAAGVRVVHRDGLAELLRQARQKKADAAIHNAVRDSIQLQL